MSAYNENPTARWDHCMAQDNARVQYGHIYIQSQHITPAQDPYGRNEQVKPRIDFVQALQFERMNTRLASIEPAMRDTCSWIFNTTEYKRWQDPASIEDHHGFLWIKGKAGSGKSTVMKCAVEHAERNSKDGIIVSFFFHARGSTLEKTVEGMYRSLLAQLLDKIPGLRSRFPAHGPFEDDRQSWPVPLLKNYMRTAICGLESRVSVMIYIDALDECDEDDIREAIEHFEELGEVSVGCREVRICFASRYYPNIRIQHSEEICLDEKPEHTQDISIYLKDKISGLNIPDVRLRDILASQIKTRSSGIFLWVVLIVRTLKKEVDRGIAHTRLLAILEAVPMKIQDLLAEILQHSDNALLAALQWVLFAHSPLTCEELYSAIHTSLGEPASTISAVPREVRENYILTTSRGLIELTVKDSTPLKRYAQFVHESVREYLLHDGLTSMDKTLSENVIGLSNARLAQWIQADERFEMAWRELKEGKLCHTKICQSWHLRQHLKTFPDFEFAYKSVFFHLNIAYRHGALSLASLQEFPVAIMRVGFWPQPRPPEPFNSASLALLFMASGEPEVAEALLAASTPYDTPDCGEKGIACSTSTANDASWWGYDPDTSYGEFVSLLFTAIHRGYVGIAATLLKHGANVDFVDTLGGCGYKFCEWEAIHVGRDRTEGDSPLTSVAGKGRKDSIALLLEYGARVDHRDDQGRTALMKLADRYPGSSTEDAVLLLAAGADVNAWTPEAGTALHLACQTNCYPHGLIPLLLTHGADVNKRRGDGQTVLHFASENGFYALAKLLLNNGANKDLRSNYSTPLSAACRWGHMNVVQLLLDEGADVSAHCGKYGSALIAASILGDCSIVKLLLDHGANPNARIKSKYGTPLGAANHLDLKDISEILRAYGADPGRLAVPTYLCKGAQKGSHLRRLGDVWTYGSSSVCSLGTLSPQLSKLQGESNPSPG